MAAAPPDPPPPARRRPWLLTVLLVTFAVFVPAVGNDDCAARLLDVVLHIVATALVYGLLRGLLARPGVAAAGALFFGLHAIHSEVVAAAFGRAQLLAFCGGAGGLLLLVHGRSLSPVRRSMTLVLAAAALYAGFRSEASAIAWIPVAACYGLARLWAREPGRGARRTSLIPEAMAVLLPLWAIPPLSLPLPAFADLPPDVTASTWLIANPIFDAPTQTRLLTGTMVWGYGLWLTLLPLSLSADYGSAVFPIVERFDQPAALLTLIAGLALSALALGGSLRARRHPLLFFGVACFFAFSTATTNLLFPIPTIFGERLYYAPSLLIAFGAAWLATSLRPRHAPLALLLAGAWLGANALTILERNALWRDRDALILQEIETQPRSVRMRLAAARVFAERGEAAAATYQLEHAVVLEPTHAPAWEHLGDLNTAARRTDRAAACYRQALQSRPADPAAAVIAGKLERLVSDRSPPRAPPLSSR